MFDTCKCDKYEEINQRVYWEIPGSPSNPFNIASLGSGSSTVNLIGGGVGINGSTISNNLDFNAGTSESLEISIVSGTSNKLVTVSVIANGLNTAVSPCQLTGGLLFENSYLKLNSINNINSSFDITNSVTQNGNNIVFVFEGTILSETDPYTLFELEFLILETPCSKTAIDYFKEELWSLQCKYGDLVSKYRWNLITGSDVKDLKKQLLVNLRILNILNNYDTRDLLLTENTYNKTTQQEIYDLILKLKNKL